MEWIRNTGIELCIGFVSGVAGWMLKDYLVRRATVKRTQGENGEG